EEEEEEDDEDEDETSTEGSESSRAPLFPVLSISFPFTSKPSPSPSTPPPTTVTRLSTAPPTIASVPLTLLNPLKSDRAIAPSSSLPTLRPMTSSSVASSTFSVVSSPRATLPMVRSTVSSPTIIPPVRQSAWRTTTEGVLEEKKRERPGTVGLLPSTVEMLVTATSPPLIVYEKEVTIPARVRNANDEK
ncbi:hypothetical protein PMAYCL1PPCAC_30177, partial [Pristionchus mayeri]